MIYAALVELKLKLQLISSLNNEMPPFRLNYECDGEMTRVKSQCVMEKLPTHLFSSVHEYTQNLLSFE